MSETLRLAWSIAKSGWLTYYNRSIRFSRLKTALIWLVIQAVFFIFLAGRAPTMSASAAGQGTAGVFALMALQMGWFGLMFGFSRGQMQLYQGILVPLFQITPARPLAFLLGRVIEAVPSRAWSTLLWAWVYSKTVPGAERIPLALTLALFGLAVGMVAHLSGLLMLAFWSRYSAKTMRNGLIFFGAATLAMATWAVIFLSKGGTVTELALAMRAYRTTVGVAVVLLGGLPGVLLLGALLVRPTAVEDLYRRGVYNVIELGEADVAKPSRSVWLPIPDPALRAILSREWLQLYRAKVVRVQLLVWVAGTVGVWFAGQAVAGSPGPRVVQFVGALSLLAWFMAFGHWVVRTFEQEKVTVALYRLAGIPTWKLLVGKFISIAVPSGVLVLISTLVGSLAAGLTGAQTGSVMAWTLGGLAGGILGGFGMAAATADEEPEDPEITAGPKRVAMDSPGSQSNAWWALARTAALVITAALPVWTGAGQPGLSAFKLPEGALLGLNVLLPLGLLVGGSWLMIRTWEANG